MVRLLRGCACDKCQDWVGEVVHTAHLAGRPWCQILWRKGRQEYISWFWDPAAWLEEC